MNSILAGLLLLLQVQPVLGAGFCAFAGGQPEQQCHSHEIGGSAGRVTGQETPPSGDCFASFLCAPTAPILTSRPAPVESPDCSGRQNSPAPLAFFQGTSPAPPAPPPRA